MNINGQIAYEWRLGWSGMSEPKPVVNRLIKAILEKNVPEMERLFACGAEIKACNEGTFGRTLFYVLNNYAVINSLVQHGFTAIYPYSGFRDNFECYDSDGYCWGCLGRAWRLGAYDVVRLLAQNGFKATQIHYKGDVYYVEELVFANDDIKTTKILLENGFFRKTIEEISSRYPNSKVTYFLQENAVIHRETIALSNFKYSEYPKPKLKKPGLFNKKRVKAYNDMLMADYYDYIRAHNQFVNSIGVEKWKNICRKLEQDTEFLSYAMCDVSNNL